jgi:hypothetical protein
MSAPIINQANAVLDALDEGIMVGTITTIKYQNPGISKKDIKRKIKSILQWNKEKFDYWCDWFNLDKKDDFKVDINIDTENIVKKIKKKVIKNKS